MARTEINPIKIGDRFGQLIVLEIIFNKRVRLMCKCDCGKTKSIAKHHLKEGLIRSCGCLRDKSAAERIYKMHKNNISHGKTDSRIYNIWQQIRQRCNNPNARFFKHYGGRGIKICDRWNDFTNFLADMGEPASGFTIDRINNDGNYEPENCRWATRKEQASNTRRNRNLTYKGITLNITQWSEKCGISPNTIITRLENGWATEDALTVHVVKQRKEVII